jgi:hypothetical protein
MSIKVYSKLIGVPKNNIPDDHKPSKPNYDHDHGHNDDHHHHKPPFFYDDKSQKIVVVQSDVDRLKLSGKELNTGDFVRVRNTGKIFLFDERGHCDDGYGFWEEYSGPVDQYGDPIIGTNPIKKKVLSALFNNTNTLILAHNLGTEDIIVNIYDTNKTKVIVDVEIVDNNTIKLFTTDPLNEILKVVIIG